MNHPTRPPLHDRPAGLALFLVALAATVLLWSATRDTPGAAPSPAVPYSALLTNDFRITNGYVGVRTSAGGGTNIFNTIYVTNNTYTSNLFVTNVTFTSNLFATNIYVSNIFVTNIDASVTITTNLYVTNIFNTFLVTSNVVAGNIHGTTNTLAMFTPDEFSVGDSIVTQPDTNTIVVNGNGTGYVQLGGTNGEQLVFGTGATNVLSRSSADLVYTNGAADVKLEVLNGSNAGIALEAQSASTGTLTVAGGAVALALRVPTAQVSLFSHAFYSTVDATESLGQSGNRWKDIHSTGTNYLWGFVSGLTNYARLETYHTGTNGVIGLDSQSAGSAGDPRPVQFQFGGTNQWTLVPGGPAISTGITKAQKTALTPTNGMIVYQTDNTPGFRAYVNGAWVIFSTAADP